MREIFDYDPRIFEFNEQAPGQELSLHDTEMLFAEFRAGRGFNHANSVDAHKIKYAIGHAEDIGATLREGLSSDDTDVVLQGIRVMNQIADLGFVKGKNGAVYDVSELADNLIDDCRDDLSRLMEHDNAKVRYSALDVAIYAECVPDNAYAVVGELLGPTPPQGQQDDPETIRLRKLSCDTFMARFMNYRLEEELLPEALRALPEREIRAAWSDIIRDGLRTRNFRANYSNAVELDHLDPEALELLSGSYNILNFARYNPRMMAKMARDIIENPSKPYALVLQSRGDHNGAFWEPEKWQKLYDQLTRKGFGLRIYECATQIDVSKAMLEVKQNRLTHGAKVAGMMIAAHGGPRRIELSEAIYMDGDDFYCALRNFPLENNITVSWDSCSTGKFTSRYSDSVPSGEKLTSNLMVPPIALQVAVELGRVSIAPKESVAYSGFRALKRGPGLIDIIPEYRRFERKRNLRRHRGYEKGGSEVAIKPHHPARFTGEEHF